MYVTVVYEVGFFVCKIGRTRFTILSIAWDCYGVRLGLWDVHWGVWVMEFEVSFGQVRLPPSAQTEATRCSPLKYGCVLPLISKRPPFLSLFFQPFICFFFPYL